jgi:hypothetical protein
MKANWLIIAGRLDKALDAAEAEGWTIVDMKN